MPTNAQISLSRYNDLSSEDRIDAICDSFEQDWKQGKQPDLSSYLNFCDRTDQPRLLTELLYVDWELRSTSGEHPSWDEYLTKLPQFAEQIEAAKFKHQACGFVEGFDPSSAKIPKRIAHFELLEKLGSGATADVWKARDTLLQRTVAIKIPRSPHQTEEELGRFLREGRAAADLKHASIARVHEVGCAAGMAYIVSDFIAGQNLRNWLKQSRPSHRQAAQYCRQIAEALVYAHQNGVVHRDLKPANVLIDDNGSLHLVDFGLAKRVSSLASISTHGHVIGTPAYMSPEQANGDGSDQRSDVYSLGIMLYEMLMGRQPFVGELDEVICAVLTKEPVRPRSLDCSIPRDLELICLKAIAKQPADRYQTADEIVIDLDNYLNGLPIKARRYRTVALAWHGVRRKLATIGLAGVTLIALLFAFKGMSANVANSTAQAMRNVLIDTVPSGAKVVFVPISPSDGQPMADRAVYAKDVSSTQASLSPGDYWVEAIWSDGRFQDVLRHVPKAGEKSFRSANHLKWANRSDGGVDLPKIQIPNVDLVTKMLLVDTSANSGATDDGNEPKQNSSLRSFYVDLHEVTVGEYLKLMTLLPNYLADAHLKSEQPIPLIYYDAVAFAEVAGLRLPTRTEWQRAQQVLPPRASSQLANWTTSWATLSPSLSANVSDQDQTSLRIAVGGSHRLIRQDGAIEPNDFDAKNWATLPQDRFFPGVGVLCVRSEKPQFFKQQ